MNIDLFNIVCGVITIFAFVFSIYSHYKTESKRVIEAGKAAMISERMKNLRTNLIKSLHVADMIVQLPKAKEVKVDELQNIARILRAEIKLNIDSLDDESQKLRNWEFGKVLTTTIPKEETE